MTTLFGTPTNILASDALRDVGLEPFGLFDFAPVGIIILLAGTLYMVVLGRFLLPERTGLDGEEVSVGIELEQTYSMRDRLSVIKLSQDSPLVGKDLRESRFGRALGLTVIGIERADQTWVMPEATTVLKAGDKLTLAGRMDRWLEIQDREIIQIESDLPTVADLISKEIGMADLIIARSANIIGQTLQQIDFRKRFGVIVLAIRRKGMQIRTNLDNLPLEPEDVLLVQGRCEELQALDNNPEFRVFTNAEHVSDYLDERLMIVNIPVDSVIAGKSLAESRISETHGLTVLGLIRDNETWLLVDPGQILLVGDRLLVKGRAEDNLMALRRLKELELTEEIQHPELKELESEKYGLIEAVLSPHTSLAGETLHQMRFREKYGLNVLALLREGKTIRSNLSRIPLEFGDALLLYGPRARLGILANDQDFLVLAGDLQPSPRTEKALLALLIMLGVVGVVLLDFLPIAIAAVIGGMIMVLTGCITMEEAYRFIEWRAVFLIAGMLPLGIAMSTSGTADFLAQTVVSLVGGLGALPMIVGLFLMTMLASQVMPNPVVTVLMAPVALNTAASLAFSPYAIMMVIAVAASTSFLSPVAHPSNVLIMGPGGYRFNDYFRVGLPLTILILLITLFVLPLFWPLYQ
jgi:di/tricarboxylate transporter